MCKFPGISGFYGMGHPPFVCWNVIIACVGGRFCAFEVKQPSGKLTRLQEVALKKIEDAGGVAGKVTSVEDVKKLLADMEAASAGEERRDI